MPVMAGGVALLGLHVLVVEDRSLIAGKIAQILRRAGCVVVGPLSTLEAGLEQARNEAIALDAAVLDIDLRGIAVYPLAETLQTRGIPLLFLTGYGALVIPQAWQATPRLEKPFDEAGLLGALRSAIVQHPLAANSLGNPTAAEPSGVVSSAWKAIRNTRDLLTEGRIVLEQGRSSPKQ